MGMFAGEYRYLKVRGKDEKGFYKIIEHEVVGEDNCSCHPETCCCADNSYRFYTKEYESGEVVSVEREGNGTVITYVEK